jgi:DNA polymerase-3 subunit beta
MKFQVLQENLAKALTTTSRFASTRAQLPILGNILLTVKKSKIFISSTNLEISASIQVGAKVEEEGEISIPAKVISELVINLPKETVTLTSEKEQLKISAASFSSTVLGMNASDFPKIPNSLEKGKTVGINKDQFSQLLNKVLFSTSIDETRPILTGVLFILSPKGLTLVSTDGFRLSRKKIPLDATSKIDKKVVIPKGILAEIPRLSDGEGLIEIGFQETEKQVLFGVGESVLASRLLEGEFPDYEKIIPKNSPIKVTLDKEELDRAVKLASIFARESANVIKIRLLGDSIKIFAESGASGNQETEVDAKVDRGGSAESFEIAFNYRFVEDFLHSCMGEEVRLEFSSSAAPGVFVDTSDPDYLHLIMPVKVQS